MTEARRKALVSLNQERRGSIESLKKDSGKQLYN